MDIEQKQGCRTPVHRSCRIPAASACPPAPKKKPVVYPAMKKQRVPPKGGYFNPPDLDLIFRVAPTREAIFYPYP
ncbi:hypothetical protein TanjilG_29461 [Lupinus angustifolius]|uniref:Uncharacterized protein n=1 Tax=Lupinus angustifolius TaxID=3871 RepID=A0A4P1R5Z1_LUPAN|nr:hypothetical protein TanjilG_29461 [Lupinus angustifolius]